MDYRWTLRVSASGSLFALAQFKDRSVFCSNWVSNIKVFKEVVEVEWSGSPTPNLHTRLDYETFVPPRGTKHINRIRLPYSLYVHENCRSVLVDRNTFLNVVVPALSKCERISFCLWTANDNVTPTVTVCVMLWVTAEIIPADERVYETSRARASLVSLGSVEVNAVGAALPLWLILNVNLTLELKRQSITNKTYFSQSNNTQLLITFSWITTMRTRSRKKDRRQEKQPAIDEVQSHLHSLHTLTLTF